MSSLRRSILRCVGVALLSSAGYAAQSVEERVQRVLSDVALDAGLSVEIAGQEILALGDNVLPPLFGALCDAIESSAGAVDASDSLAGRTESTLLYVFERTPAARLNPFLEGQATAAALPRARVAALRILEITGSAREFGLMMRLANTENPEPSIERALESTLDALLARDHATYVLLERAYPPAPIPTRRALIGALSRTGSFDGLKILSRLLYREEPLRALLLVTIGRMSRELPRPIGEDVLSNVRRFVAEADPIALPEAILAVGYLDDCESIPQLIALLKSSRRGLAANALWSLRRITGLGIAETPDRWTSWHQSEREWWQRTWPSTLAALHGADARAIKVALMDVSTRHLHRHAIAVEVAELVAHPDVEVATLACTTLSSTRAPRSRASPRASRARTRSCAWRRGARCARSRGKIFRPTPRLGRR